MTPESVPATVRSGDAGRLRQPLVVAGTLLVAVVAALLIAEQIMGAPQRDVELLALFLVISGGLSLVLGSLAIRLAGGRIGSLRLRLALASGVGLCVALANVLTTSALMFLNAHDLALLLLLLGFAAAVSLAFAYVVAGVLTADIQALAQAAHQLAGGDLKTRVGVRGSDEVARLAATFDYMADRLQEAFERQRALESSRRELVSAVSHDLRTPLATTRAMVEALADGVVTEPADVQRYLGLIRQEIQHLSRLIDDLFELSQIDSGALDLHCVAVDLGQLVSQAVAAYQVAAAAQGINLSADIDAADPDAQPIHADPDRLQRVIRNLLENALHHTPPDGVVRVKARFGDGGVGVSVSDSGAGIPPGEEERIFERFYRAEPSRRRAVATADGAQSTGSGLGLAIARALIQAHGGRIWAEPSPLGGASLHFTLPLDVNVWQTPRC